MAEEWTPERTSALMEYWNQGLSTSEIGRRLSVTKNAVVGKVHRLNLPKRGSPIQAPRTPIMTQPVGDHLKLEKLSAGMCSWPEGDPGTPEFRFCGNHSVPGKPYCAEPCAKAYGRPSRDGHAGEKAA